MNIGRDAGQPLTADKEENEKHCPTKQSSGRLAAAADFVVRFRLGN